MEWIYIVLPTISTLLILVFGTGIWKKIGVIAKETSEVFSKFSQITSADSEEGAKLTSTELQELFKEMKDVVAIFKKQNPPPQ